MKMANVKLMVIVMIGMVLFFEGCKGLSICGVSDDGFNACKPSVTQPKPTKPSAKCCQAVKGADLKCLCSYKSSPMLPALGIDPMLAIALPRKCGLPPAKC